jgi:hypothetical protein
MSINEELLKLNKCVEDYIMPTTGKHKFLIEATVLIDVNRDFLEEQLRGEWTGKPLSFTQVICGLEHSIVGIKRLPDGINGFYIVDINREPKGV